MERVAFIVDATGERIDCLLNPETFEVRRLGGVRGRRSAGGALVGTGLADDPLLFTGGGRTELPYHRRNHCGPGIPLRAGHGGRFLLRRGG